MNDPLAREKLIDFGELPPAIDALLQQGVATYRRDRDAAERLFRAALQAGWPDDFRAWSPSPGAVEGPGRFALYTLKALAFIHLRRDERAQAQLALVHLERLDPSGSIGWPVVAALAEGLG